MAISVQTAGRSDLHMPAQKVDDTLQLGKQSLTVWRKHRYAHCRRRVSTKEVQQQPIAISRNPSKTQ